MPQQAVMQINPGRCLVNRREASHIYVVICRISRTTLGDRATNPGPRSWEASAKMFTAEQYREKAAPWFVPPLVIPIAFAILWVGFVLHRTFA